MVSIEDLTLEEKGWLLAVFPTYTDKVLRGVNVDAYSKAERLMLGESNVPECSCSYNSYQSRVNSLYKKWLENNT